MFSKEYISQPRYVWIFAVFVFAMIGENAFGSSDTDSIAGGFAASYSHIFYIGSALIGTAGLIALFPNLNPIFPSFFLFYIIMAFYAMISSFWGTALVKSAGLSIILVLNLIWASAIGYEIRKVPESKRFSVFVDFWIIFFLINFTVENLFKGVFANLDEFSLIAMILSFMVFRKGNFVFSFFIFLLALSGQSFSAILGFILFVIIYYFDRMSRIWKVILLFLYAVLILFAIQVEWLGLIEQSGITIYGKDSSVIISGSGRFNAWQAVYDAIRDSNWMNFIFGHGYATDRDVLNQMNFTWTVDVHNNILHIFYGIGLIGFFLFVIAIVKSMKISMIPDFRRYRFAILVSFIFFGFSSSYFFGRPSSMAVFWLSFLTAGWQQQAYAPARNRRLQERRQGPVQASAG